MKIVVNTRLLIKGKLSGIGWFTYQTLKRMVLNNPGHEFIFLFDRKYDSEFIFASNVTPVIVFPPTRHPVLQLIWLELAIPRIIKKYNADVFFSPDGFSTLRSGNIKKLITIHDINFHHNPKDLPFFDSLFWRKFIPRYAHNANKITTVSEYSKKDICKSYNIPEEKISVVYNGANEIYCPVPESIKTEIKNKFTNGDDYFLYVGVLVPRKNISRLLIAFEKFKKQTNSDTKLIIVGNRMLLTGEMDRVYNNSSVKHEIVFTGTMEPNELYKVMGSALSLVLVSYFEGFGIPVVEAMYAEVPVITSDISSLPEVAGDAALLVNPFSTDDICRAMSEIYSNKNLRNTLVEKAKIQRTKFNWDISAKKIWEIIEILANNSNSK